MSALSNTPRTAEKNTERMLRYSAEQIAARPGKSLQDALEIARAFLAEEARNRDAQRKSKKKTASIIRARNADKSKAEWLGNVKVHGPPLRGGAPGLGKR
jgi:hypothetical protein